jgi:glycosyltransferase involved in cell wall biosynthesis
MKVFHCAVFAKNNKYSFGGGVGGYSNYTDRLQELDGKFAAVDINFIYFSVSHANFLSRFFIGDLYRVVRDIVAFTLMLLKHRPSKLDIVHIHGLYGRSSLRELAFVWLAKLFNCRVYYEARAGHFAFFISQPTVLAKIARKMLKKCDFFTIQGNGDIATIESQTGKKPVVHGNYLSSSFCSTVDRERRKLANLSKKTDVVFVGYVSLAKGCEKFAALAHQFPKYKFTLVGEVESSIKNILNLPNIELTGRLEKKEIIKILLTSKIFAYPSQMIGEGQPNSVIEALYCGLNVIAYNHGYISDLVADNFLVDKRHGLSGFASTLEWSLAQPLKSRQASKIDIEKLDDNAQFEKLYEIYERI